MKSVYEIKKEICEVGHILYELGFVAANDGNISVKVGENDKPLRQNVCREMSYLGIAIDEELNMNTPKGAFAELTAPGAKVRTFVIPTNEEYMIALDTLALANK